jgi:hypothetical protein
MIYRVKFLGRFADDVLMGDMEARARNSGAAGLWDQRWAVYVQSLTFTVSLSFILRTSHEHQGKEERESETKAFGRYTSVTTKYPE